MGGGASSQAKKSSPGKNVDGVDLATPQPVSTEQSRQGYSSPGRDSPPRESSGSSKLSPSGTDSSSCKKSPRGGGRQHKNHDSSNKSGSSKSSGGSAQTRASSHSPRAHSHGHIHSRSRHSARNDDDERGGAPSDHGGSSQVHQRHQKPSRHSGHGHEHRPKDGYVDRYDDVQSGEHSDHHSEHPDDDDAHSDGVNEENMDSLAYSAMSLGMDHDELLFNMFYFGGGEESGTGFRQSMNTAIEETYAAHSTGNTPYKLRPATEDIIHKHLTSDVDFTAIPDAEECLICQEQLKDPAQSIAMISACKHVFHEECILRWFTLQNWCPICRAVLSGSDNCTEENEGPVTEGQQEEYCCDDVCRRTHSNNVDISPLHANCLFGGVGDSGVSRSLESAMFEATIDG